LVPDEHVRPQFAQLYFLDDEAQLNARLDNFTTRLHPDVLADLQQTMNDHNPYVELFKYGLELTRADANVETLLLCIRPANARADPNAHARTYNAPGTSEVAAIIPGDPDARPHHTEIILNLREGGLQIINSTSPHYDPLHYVCFYMKGELGWEPDIPMTGPNAPTQPGQGGDGDGGGGDDEQLDPALDPEQVLPQPKKKPQTEVSCKNFFCYVMMVRAGVFNVFHHGIKLFQQYVVDQFCKWEASEMGWIRAHQKQLRVSTYNVVQQAAQIGEQLGGVGTYVVLPSTFIGSPRHLQQCYQDAMAIVRHHGKPSLFITMTCNPGICTYSVWCVGLTCQIDPLTHHAYYCSVRLYFLCLRVPEHVAY